MRSLSCAKWLCFLDVVLFDVQIVVSCVHTSPNTAPRVTLLDCLLRIIARDVRVATSRWRPSMFRFFARRKLSATFCFAQVLCFRKPPALIDTISPISLIFQSSRPIWAPSRPLILLMLSSNPMADLLLSASRVRNSTLLTLPPDFKNWFPTCACHPNIMLHPNRLHGLDHRTSVAPSRV